jgi:V8-like Glu-specific endopeptidase
MHRALRPALALALAALASSAACTAPAPDAATESTSTRHARIIGGTPASAYPEAVLIDVKQNGQVTGSCSGALIAPGLVLTAGHCVHGFDGWDVTAPFANGATASGSKSEVLDYAADGPNVDPDMHDVAVVFLDAPVTIASYPQIAKSKLADGTPIVTIGRIQDGNLSDSQLFVSKPTPVSDGSAAGYPHDYAASEIIEHGDSGGPDEILQNGVHTIVAVNSGAGQGTEVLARVDLVADWIEQQIAAAGDGGPQGAGGADPGQDPNDPGNDPNGQGGADPGQDPGQDPGGQRGADPGDEGGGDPASCNGVDEAGTCNGNVLRYCEDGFAFEVDCAQMGATCGQDPDSGYYDCL